MRTARLLTNDDQNTLPLDQSGYTDILVPKEPSNPHAIVSASTLSFLSTLRANEIIQLACYYQEIYIENTCKRDTLF